MEPQRSRFIATGKVSLADAKGHRALTYVDAVSRHGHRLTIVEFNAFMAAPSRQVTTSGGPHTAALRQLSASVSGLFGRSSRESILDWLTRVMWLAQDGHFIRITPLGRAVLGALDEAGREEEAPQHLVLTPSDELAYARVIGAIAEVGPCALVDGYFGLDQLLDILQRTEVTRVLVFPGEQRGRRGDLSALQQGVASVRVDRRFEIRASDEFHDRFVIPDEGPVRFIGTSLSGVGRRLALTGELSEDVVSESVREAFEAVWQRADSVVDAEPEQESEPIEPEPVELEAEEAS